jgi:cytochrome c oxidase subunit 2
VPPITTILLAMKWWLPSDAAAHGPALDSHLLLNLWLMFGLLIAAHLAIFGALLYRRRVPETHDWKWEYIPLGLFVLLFAGLGVQAQRLWAAARYTGADLSAMQVEVTGMQFVWYFRYPGQDAHFGQVKPQLVDAGAGNPLGLDPKDPTSADDIVAGELVLPAGREVDLRIRSQDVIHGFFVPSMRLKQNAVPGQTIHVHFTPQTPGTYPILCTQVCGLGHYRMQAQLRVLPPDQFAAWLKQHAPQPATSTSASTQQTSGFALPSVAPRTVRSTRAPAPHATDTANLHNRVPAA